MSLRSLKDESFWKQIFVCANHCHGLPWKNSYYYIRIITAIRVFLVYTFPLQENDNTEPKAKIAKLSDDSKSANEESKDKTEEPSGDNSEKSKEEISQEEQSKLKSEGGTKPVAATAVDEIEETLLCSICQELLYNCIR